MLFSIGRQSAGNIKGVHNVRGYARIRACTKHHALTYRTRLDLRAEFIAQHSATFRSPPQHSAALCKSTSESWVLLRSAAESCGVLRVRAAHINSATHRSALHCERTLNHKPDSRLPLLLPGYLTRSSPPLTGYNLCCSTNRHMCDGTGDFYITSPTLYILGYHATQRNLYAYLLWNTLVGSDFITWPQYRDKIVQRDGQPAAYIQARYDQTLALPVMV